MNDTILADNYLLELQRQWHEQDEGALLIHALSFLEFKSLLQKERVNKEWWQLKTFERSFLIYVHQKRALVSLPADPPGSQVSGALQN
jgi:hypothetical protein